MAVRRVRYGADFGPDPDIAPLPLRVTSGHFVTSDQCPLCPRKRTLMERAGMSA
jgi:hypothetical protein